AYFMVNSPARGTMWKNGEVAVFSWEKGIEDGVDAFDLELSRLSDTGLTYVALNVPSGKHAAKSLNIYLEDIPEADDYFLIALNSTHGGVYSTSQRFTILDASSSSSGNESVSVTASVATVTVSGSPNPTIGFATTFALSNGAVRLLGEHGLGVTWGLTTALVGCMAGAMLTLW
ncbi:hypothetical protein FISHEDRAFT_33088, partial [Fistulina hepatica ATCC 64428]